VSLLGVLLAVLAFIIACALVAFADQQLGSRLAYPRWCIHLAYGLLALVLIIFLCKAFGVFELLAGVKV
jgi:hypothetical protein